MKKNGFTLLEILIVATIMIGVTGFAISNYNDFNRIERLRQTAKTLKSDLRLAQTQANSGIKPPSCNLPGVTLLGYTVSFTQTTYSIQATCSNGAAGPVMTVTFPVSSGVTFVPVPAAIRFNVLNGSSTITQTLTLSGASHTYKISVSTSGDINDSGNGLGFQ